MRVQAWALALVAVISLVMPVLEMLLTGRVEELGKFALVQNLLSIPPIFWWYHVDKAEHDYRAGPLMNGGMLLAIVIAMPVYFVRSRGWKGGAMATVVAIGVFALLLGLGEAAEYVAKKMAIFAFT